MNPTQKTTILVVDDALENLQVLGELLEYEGCEVLVATQGNRALEIAASALPDAIFLDVTMPGMDGFELCSALKTNPVTASVPVYFLSGHIGRSTRDKGMSLGADGFLTKPFHWEEIQKILRSLPGG